MAPITFGKNLQFIERQCKESGLGNRPIPYMYGFAIVQYCSEHVIFSV